MANFGVILLECETLIKEAQTSRDKLAVLEKAVTDAQALVDRCKAFAGKNKQALMLAKVQEDDVKRKATVRDDEHAKGQQMERTLQAKLSELQSMSSSVDAGLKSKFEGLQHRANDLRNYHGSASNVPGLTANEIMRLATATEAKATPAAPTLVPPPAMRGASDGTLLVSPRQKESVSQPSSPAPLHTPVHHHAPAVHTLPVHAHTPVHAVPTVSAPSTPTVAAGAPTTPSKAAAPSPAPNSPVTRGPMLGTNSPRSVTMYGTMRASSAPREPRTPVAAKPTGNEAPAATPEVRKTWNQRASNNNSTTPVTLTPKHAPATPSTLRTSVGTSSSAPPTPATVVTSPPSPKAALTPEPPSSSAATSASATSAAAPEKKAETTPAVTPSVAVTAPAEAKPVPKFNLVVVEEEQQTVMVKKD